MWEIHTLGLTRRGLETGFREPRQPSTLPVGGAPGNRCIYPDEATQIWKDIALDSDFWVLESPSRVFEVAEEKNISFDMQMVVISIFWVTGLQARN